MLYKNVRFTSSRGWCADDDNDEAYFQVEFQNTLALTAVQTLGRADLGQWVSSYSVNTSMDGVTWSSISSKGEVKVFAGNFDKNTVVTNELERYVVAQFIRILPVSAYTRMSMRLEVKGCPVSTLSTGTCNKWKAKVGSAGDVFQFLKQTNAANQGSCGLMCYRQPDCDSFVFVVSSNRCILMKSNPIGYYSKLYLHDVWYFIKSQ